MPVQFHCQELSIPLCIGGHFPLCVVCIFDLSQGEVWSGHSAKHSNAEGADNPKSQILLTSRQVLFRGGGRTLEQAWSTSVWQGFALSHPWKALSTSWRPRRAAGGSSIAGFGARMLIIWQVGCGWFYCSWEGVKYDQQEPSPLSSLSLDSEGFDLVSCLREIFA